MAFLFADSFQHYADGDKLKKWASSSSGASIVVPTITAGVGRRGNAGLRIATTSTSSGNGYSTLGKTLSTSGGGFVAGFAIKLGRIPIAGNGAGIFTVYDGSTAQFTLRANSDMTLSGVRGTQNGTVVGVTSASLSIGTYAHVQVKCTLATGVGGSFEIKINDATATGGSISGINTAGAGTTTWTNFTFGPQIDQWHFVAGTTTAAIDICDFWLLDLSGGSFNDFLGDVRVDARAVTGAGSTTQFTASAGSNYQNVDDSTPNDDTDYNTSSTVGHIDTFVVEDAPVVGGGVLAVQTCIYAKKSDAGTCTIAPVIRHGGVNTAGTALSPSTSYQYLISPMSTNPATGAAWVESDFNADEFGYKKVT